MGNAGSIKTLPVEKPQPTAMKKLGLSVKNLAPPPR